MQAWASAGTPHLPFAFIVFNVDPILVHIGGIAVHWYGLAYVVAICVALWVTLRWARNQGLHDDQMWGLFLWTALAGLVGGRLYFVIQQPNLVQDYLKDPINIIAVWNGGMAFFGAIFLGTAMLVVLAPRYGINRFLLMDVGALFAAVGQIFGRVGNIVNGDILGKMVSNGPVALPADVCAHAPCIASVANSHIPAFAIVYLNPNSFAPQDIAYLPAPVFEMLANIIALAILWRLRYRLPARLPGLFFTTYLALYAIGQFIVFYFRGSEPYTPFLGIDGLKQAQWTAVITLLLCVPLLLLVRRYSRRWPYSAKNPAPWPLPAGGQPAASLVAATTAPMALTQAVSHSGPVSAAVANGVRPARPQASAPAAPADGDENLPPWHPTHATNGQLRNLFDGEGPSATT